MDKKSSLQDIGKRGRGGVISRFDNNMAVDVDGVNYVIWGFLIELFRTLRRKRRASRKMNISHI